MTKALSYAETALKRGDFPVGCVITYANRVIATGERTGTNDTSTNELDHAEINALRQLSIIKSKEDIDLTKVTLYSTLEPCLMCFSAIMINGITRVVYAFEDAMGGGTNLDRTTLSPLYRNLQLEIIPGICRSKSLNLFKIFFSNNNNKYLNDSYLAQYIRSQKL